jgi:hypothetical protein
MMHTDPYASGVLTKEHHDRLVADLDGHAKDAGIQQHWIWTPLAATCGGTEIDYVRRFKKHRVGGLIHGLCYVKASFAPDVEDRMFALAGAMVRNFVRGRVMTVGAVLDRIAKADPLDASALLIPNFFIAKAQGGGISSWHIAALYDLLVQRAARGDQTVIYATSLDDLGNEYGASFGALVQSHFLKVDI